VASGPPQFENWFAESDDALGRRFELRFNTRAQAMDIGAWEALSVIDQIQAAHIIRLLPVWLERLAQRGVPLSRPWTDWIAASRNMGEVLAACVAVDDLLAGLLP
jgi:hypothetical protein